MRAFSHGTQNLAEKCPLSVRMRTSRRGLSRSHPAQVPGAAGVLAGRGFLLSPAIAAVLMSLSTVIVAINAQLLRRART